MLQHAEIQLGFALFRRVRGRLTPSAEGQTLYTRTSSGCSPRSTTSSAWTHSLVQGAGTQEKLSVLMVLALRYELFPRAISPSRRYTVEGALVDGCTTAPADYSKVDVLTLKPAIPATVKILRPTARHNSRINRAFTRCMNQALQKIS